ncbi:DUF4249 domain-containing protein [Flagellimonas zhangzhouensis]|nr:DUF4249 domain-containing protein [Allomuricauda zhangzhouensis]
MAKYISTVVIPLMVISCVEPFDAASEIETGGDLEGALIVESNITNVEKTQKVYLSRMQRVESDSTVNVEEERLFNATTPIIIERGLETNYESGAQVVVTDNNGNSYVFQETEEGTYESEIAFAAMPNTSYQLAITTADGEHYESEAMETPEVALIDNLYVERMESGSGQDGVGIFVDASFSDGGAKLLRYNYEETYKIIAPKWTAFEFEIIREDREQIEYSNGETEVLHPDVRLVPRAREERVCYRTDLSNEEVLLNANVLSGTVAKKNLVRFISNQNPIISHRYSILVKQMAVSAKSYEFYERLVAFSQSESLFSQIQPGRLEGNVLDVDGSTTVIGFFDVSTEVQQRLYFNYEDLFPGEPLPPYFGEFDCERPVSPQIPNPERDGPTPPLDKCPQDLITRVKLGLVEYWEDNYDPGLCEGPYWVVPAICGDCNVVGSNIVPDFWEE